MADELIAVFSYPFMQRALIVGVLVSLCAALLGTSLVLKRYSMIGDGLSHVGYGAFAIAAAAGIAPLAFAIPVVVASAFLLLYITRKGKMGGDSAIAILSSSALAIGMIVLALNRVTIDINSYMFGSILALSEEDVVLSVICSVVVCIAFILLYHRIFAVTFDESFASATGIRSGIYNAFISVLTAIVIVVGMRLMGALLISSLMIFPSLSSMRVCRGFRSVTICSAAVSVICFTVGLVGSYFVNVPTGAGIVAVDLAVFLVFALAGRLKEKR
ncbi:MAG: metal ABC transporter permease [Ruminiclostridium sp.]|nr:metal ABC transporter permease [Ruminiclostridium sp.]